MNKSHLMGSIAALTIALAASASAASILNLTTEEFGGVAPTDSGIVNGALFDVTFQQPTGTGVIDPFLRLQSNNVDSYGMNTDANNVLDNKGGIWTHDLQLFQLAEHNGYYEFLLDINEPNGSRPLIMLEQLTLSTAAVGGLTYEDVRQPSIAATLRYNLDGAGDASVLLDYSRNHGSGSGDLLIRVSTSLFAGLDPETYLYLFAGFDKDPENTATGNHEPSGGFEEFATIRAAVGPPVSPIPEPGSALIGMLVMGLAATRFGARSRPQS